MSSRTVAIVQARMGSVRFPGKMMSLLADRPLIEWVLRRVVQARLLNKVILATSRAPTNDALVSVAESLGVAVFRGDEEDVLGRFNAAAQAAEAEIVVRVCADNPFTAPEEIDRVVSLYRKEQPDYAFNHIPRLGNNYADGFGAEVFGTPLLARLAAETREQRHREHVTAYIWDHPDRFRIATMPAPSSLAFPDLHFDVDEPRDLEELHPCALAVGLNGSAADVVRTWLHYRK